MVWLMHQISGHDDNYELSFDYLFAKDSLKWVTFVALVLADSLLIPLRIKTPYGIFASMCLQSMVDELVRLKKNERLRVPADRPRYDDAGAGSH